MLEIGPGKGIITRQLAKACSRVIAIERDACLCHKLKHDFRSVSNVLIHSGNFLTCHLPGREFKIFASIPFNITSAILAHITKGLHLPTDAYLLLQEEAARKYAGLPYAKESLKSLLLKPRFELTILRRLANTDFSPVPRADIMLLHLHKRPSPLLRDHEYRQYKDFLCFVFSQHGADIGARMKSVFTQPQLRRLAQAWRFSLTARPIDLSLNQWLGIFSYYSTAVSLEKQNLVHGAENRLLQQQHRLVKIHRNRNCRDFRLSNRSVAKHM